LVWQRPTPAVWIGAAVESAIGVFDARPGSASEIEAIEPKADKAASPAVERELAVRDALPTYGGRV